MNEEHIIKLQRSIFNTGEGENKMSNSMQNNQFDDFKEIHGAQLEQLYHNQVSLKFFSK